MSILIRSPPPAPSTLFLWIYSSKTSISPFLSYIISFSFLYWNLTRLSIVAFHEDENFLHALSLSLSLTLRHTQHPQFISPTPPPTRAKHRGSLWWETETICWFGAYELHSKAIDGKTERKEDAKRPKWQREKGKQRGAWRSLSSGRRHQGHHCKRERERECVQFPLKARCNVFEKLSPTLFLSQRSYILFVAVEVVKGGGGVHSGAGRNGCAFDRFESTMSPKGFPRRISVEGDLKSSLRFYFERRRNEKTIGLINKHIAALMSKRKFNMGGSPYLGGLICITILRPGFECQAHHLCFFQIVLL